MAISEETGVPFLAALDRLGTRSELVFSSEFHSGKQSAARSLTRSVSSAALRTMIAPHPQAQAGITACAKCFEGSPADRTGKQIARLWLQSVTLPFDAALRFVGLRLKLDRMGAFEAH
jgi:hypothetical protein